ncbi:MAG: TraR/DksA family transcriptional regulator [Paracoccaceae bacterium]
MTSIDQRRAALTARREELEARIAEIEDALEQPPNRDDEERATERESDEVLENMGHAATAEIRMIDAALKRLERDEYGFCVKCGEEIQAERLDLLPYTPFCQRCAS